MRFLVRALAATLLVATTCPARAAEGSVAILEGPLKARSWDGSPPRVTDRFVEPAFALAAVPTAYDSRRNARDRSQPYVLRATATLTLPAGEHDVLLRGKNAVRLHVDGALLAELDF